MTYREMIEAQSKPKKKSKKSSSKSKSTLPKDLVDSLPNSMPKPPKFKVPTKLPLKPTPQSSTEDTEVLNTITDPQKTEEEIVEANIGNVKKGKYYKSYSELCRTLGITPKKGQKKTNQIELLKCFMDLNFGQEIYVKKIYEIPYPYLGDSKKSPYLLLTKAILMKFLINQKEKGNPSIFITKKKLVELVGLVGFNFNHYLNKKGFLSNLIETEIDPSDLDSLNNPNNEDVPLTIEKDKLQEIINSLDDKERQLFREMENYITEQAEKKTPPVSIEEEKQLISEFCKLNCSERIRPIVDDFYSKITYSTSHIIENVLKDLEKYNLVTYERIYAAVEMEKEETFEVTQKRDKYGDTQQKIEASVNYKPGRIRSTTAKEREAFLAIKEQELVKLNCSTIQEAIITNQQSTFFLNVNKRVKKELNLYNIFVGLRISINVDSMKENLLETAEDIKELNGTFVEKTYRNFLTRSKKDNALMLLNNNTFFNDKVYRSLIKTTIKCEDILEIIKFSINKMDVIEEEKELGDWEDSFK